MGDPASGVAADIRAAHESGQPIRLHAVDGEIIVAQVLGCDAEHVIYKALTSTHPERYAVCDSTGFALALARIDRTQLLQHPARES